MNIKCQKCGKEYEDILDVLESEFKCPDCGGELTFPPSETNSDGLSKNDIFSICQKVEGKILELIDDSREGYYKLANFLNQCEDTMSDIHISCLGELVKIDIHDIIHEYNLKNVNDCIYYPHYYDYRIDSAKFNDDNITYSTSEDYLKSQLFKPAYWRLDDLKNPGNRESWDISNGFDGNWCFEKYEGSLWLHTYSQKPTIPKEISGSAIICPIVKSELLIENTRIKNELIIIDPSCEKIVFNNIKANSLMLVGTNRLSDININNSEIRHLKVIGGKQLKIIEVNNCLLEDIKWDADSNMNQTVINADGNPKIGLDKNIKYLGYSQFSGKKKNQIASNKLSHFFDSNILIHFKHSGGYRSSLYPEWTINESFSNWIEMINRHVNDIYSYVKKDKSGRCQII